MGSFQTTIINQRKQIPEVQFFYDKSLSKTQQFYSSYKTISDTFAIDDTQFIQIFGSYQNVFQVLDTDDNLLIDGLELFSGIALFSKIIRFQDKVQFIFSLFDFNNIKSLSLTDLEFLLLSCCTVTQKLLAIKMDLNEDIIVNFLKEQKQLKRDERVNISQMIKWANNSKEVKKFIEVIHFEDEKQNFMENLSSSSTIKLYKNHEKICGKEAPFQQVNNQAIEGWLQSTRKLEEENILEENDFSSCEVRVQPKWVYGIRNKDVKYFVDLINSWELVYFIGKIAVITNLKSSKQRHYLQHTNQIICLTTYQEIVATSECCTEPHLSPSIKIWNSINMKTIDTIVGLHLNSIHLLKFTKNGTHLITCGIQQSSPVIIYKQGTPYIPIYSVSCCHPCVQISVLEGLTEVNTNEFVIATLYGIKWFQINEKDVKCEDLQNSCACKGEQLNNIYIYGDFSQINCCTFIVMNTNLKFLCDYDSYKEKMVITGHEKGEILIWSFNKKEILNQLNFTSDQSEEILKIIPSRNHILVCKKSSKLDFWNVNLRKKQLIKSIDITSLQVKLSNYNIAELIPSPLGFYIIMTQKGQFFFLHPKTKSSHNFKSQIVNGQYLGEIIPNIFAIEGKIHSHQMVERQNSQTLIIMGGSSGILYTINHQTHSMIEQWNIGEEILDFDCFEVKNIGIIMAAATLSNKVYTRYNFIEKNDQNEMQKGIKCIRLCSDNSGSILVGLQGGNICVLTHSMGIGTTNRAVLASEVKTKKELINIKKIKLPSTPICITNMDKKTVLVATQDNLFYLLSLKDYHYRVVEEGNPIPSILSVQKPFIETYYYMKQKKKKLPIIMGINPKIICISYPDGQIHIWKNTQFISKKQKIQLHLYRHECSKISINKKQTQIITSGSEDEMICASKIQFFVEPSRSVANSGRISYSVKFESDRDDPIIKREFDYCTFKNDILGEKYDQHLLIRGIENQTLNKVFKFQIEKWKKQNKISGNKKPPQMGLNLSYVYGIQTYHLHSNVLSLTNPFRILYFVSRVIVIYNPKTNSQKIYQGHKYKVTCLIKLCAKNLIASGECSYQPTIKIWNSSSLETIRTIYTVHKWGIIRLATIENRILSYGIYDKENEINSIQMSDFHSGKIIACRKFKQIIYSLAINPLSTNEFITTGDNNITFWEIKENDIRRQSICQPNLVITCCFCRLFQLRNSMKMEVVVGSRSGVLGVVTEKRRFITLQEKAHSKRITSLSAIYEEKQRKSKIKYLISISQDETMKIWNKRIGLVYEQDIRKIEFEETGSKSMEKDSMSVDKNVSVQSVCSFVNGNIINIVLALRNGNVIMVEINPTEVQKSPQTQFKIEKNNIKYILYLKNHSSQASNLQYTNLCQKKVLFTHHPKYQIIVTIASDNNLLFWDTQRNIIIMSRSLGYLAEPTVIKYSRDGQLLIIGYSDGSLIFLDSFMSRAHQGKGDDKYVLPSLRRMKIEKNEKTGAVLNIEVSESGDHLAVSYNNLMKKQKKVESSYITLFLNKSKEKTKNYSNKMDNSKTFESFSKISKHEAESIFKTEKDTNYGLAAYFMSFAEFQTKTYLLIYYQLVDGNQNILNVTKGGKYVVWDVNTSTVTANLDMVLGIIWKKINIPNSIYTKYQIYQAITLKDEKKQSHPLNNNLRIPYMSAMVNLSDYLILGSINGDLHIVKSSSLEFENFFEVLPEVEEMFMAKTFPAHCSEISQIEINSVGNYIYTNSHSDQCVFKWKIQTNDCLIEEKSITQLETKNYSEKNGDLFNEIPSKEQLQNQLLLYKQRFRVEEKKNPSDFIQKIRLINVFGRKAFNIRNNLKYDEVGNILYHTGHLIVNIKMEETNEDRICRKREFFYTSYEQSEEISCMCMSSDKKILAVGHNGLKASVSLWEVLGKIQMKKIVFCKIVSILYLRISESNDRLLLYGMEETELAYILIVEIQSQNVLGVVNFIHQPIWSIKDIQFYPNSHSKFVTCGIEETNSWELIGQQLTYSTLLPPSTENDKTHINICLSFIKKSSKIVTGSDDGTLIVWGNEGYSKQQHCDIILSLISCGQDIIVSGSQDGWIIVWIQVQNVLNVHHKLCLKSKEELYKTKINRIESNQMIQFQIQSIDLICLQGNRQISENSIKLNKRIMTSEQNKRQSQFLQNINYHWKIIVGTKSGDIYELSMFPDLNQRVHVVEKANLIQVNHDQSTPKAFFFYNDRILFEVTDLGRLTVHNLKDSSLIYSYDFNNEIINMIYSERNNAFIIIFKSEVRSYELDKESNALNLQNSLSNILSRLQIKFITHAVISQNQKMLCLGVEKNSNHNICVSLYSIQESKLILTYSVNDPIEYLDFSLNNLFLLVKTQKELIARDLQKSQNVPEKSIPYYEWMDQGQSQYNRNKNILDNVKGKIENTIIKTLQVRDNIFILIDEHSNIYAYSTECKLIGSSKLKISDPSVIRFSNSKKLLGIASNIDRNIVVFQISLCLKD